MRQWMAVTILVCLVLFCAAIGVGQDRFYYAGTKKIKLLPSPDKVVVVHAPGSSDSSLARWLENQNLVSQYGAAVRRVSRRLSVVTRNKDQLSTMMNRLSQNTGLSMVSPVYATEDGAELIPTDEVIVQFKKGTSDAEIQAYIARHRLVQVPLRRPKKNYYRFRIPRGGDPLTLANTLHESNVVEWSQPNFIPQLIKPQVIPNDTHFPRQFQMHNTGQVINGGRSGTADADVDAPEAWRYASGQGIIVAVIDEGVERGNPDLPAARMVAGYDFGDDDNDPSPAGDGAHGTACAGIIGATQNNARGVSGIAPACRIMPIKIWRDDGNSATVADIADAIDFAWSHGADVLSNSWGFGTSAHDAFPAITAAIDSALTYGRGGKGSIVVFAAGNTANHDISSNGYVTFPANHPPVFTVGATDRNDDQAIYSPTDDELDLVAPSHRAYCSQIAGEDFEVWSTDILGAAGYNPINDPSPCQPAAGTQLPAGDLDFTGMMGGTSAACPLVAGIAALVLQVNPNLTHEQVEEILRHSADRIHADTLPYDSTGFNRQFGFGRANAHRSLVPTVRITITPPTVQRGSPFDITVTSTAPLGLSTVWWFGENTGIAALDQAHMQGVPSSPATYTYTWRGVTIDSRGTFRIGANARDIAYPNPGDGIPHQASEGGGIAYAEVKVTPVSATWAALVTGLLVFVLAAVEQRKRVVRRLAGRS